MRELAFYPEKWVDYEGLKSTGTGAQETSRDQQREKEGVESEHIEISPRVLVNSQKPEWQASP